MKNLLKNMKEKFNTIAEVVKEKTMKFAIKTQGLRTNAKLALSNSRGESSVSQAIMILIAVVLDVLLLAGLYELFDSAILPRLETEINNMFNYSG